MAAQPSPHSTNIEEDYSASATLTHFDRPIPLLRCPIPSGPKEDPNFGPYVLAFPNPQSFLTSLKFCKSKLVEQCEAGLRIGCSITASNYCKPPFWKILMGKIDFKERSQCEEREMAACLVGSGEKCGVFAKEKCLGAFGSARGVFRGRRLRKKEVGGLISWVSGLGLWGGNSGFEVLVGDQLRLLPELSLSYDVTYIRGSEILEDQNQLK